MSFKFPYFVKNSILFCYLKCLDAIFFKRANAVSFDQAKNILIGNIAHLGDVVITFDCIATIKHACPKAKLYFISSSASCSLLKGLRNLDGIVIFDHIKHQRNRSLLKKVFYHITSFFEAISLIKGYGIDLYIETYPFYSNGVFLSYFAGVASIIGYGTGGGLSILDKSFPIFPDSPLKLQNYQWLKEFGLIRKKQPYPFKSTILLPENFVLIHLEAGTEKKTVSISEIKPLLDSFLGPFVFTGTSPSLKKEIDEFKDGKKVINLIGRCDLSDLIQVVQRAKKVISVDTVVYHLAEHFSIPLLLVKKERINENLFDPLCPSTRVIFIKEGQPKDVDFEIAAQFFSQ
jgi:ADP-heptose:LPS heptosyltransferase